MPTMEMDNDGHWTDPDPNKCLECKKARECTTKYFELDREYPQDEDHCECGHVTNVFRDTTEEAEARLNKRVRHTQLCSDHSWQVWEAMSQLKDSYKPE